MQKRPMKPQTAQMRLETLCARGEHCRYELTEKLKNWGISATDSEQIMNSLERRHFFDDNRFASAYVRDKVIYNRWGRLKIAFGLRTKRIDASIIRTALDEIEEEEYLQALTDTLRMKARSIKEGNTYDGRTKLYRAAISRGYEPSLVSTAIKAGGLWDE